MVVLDTSTLILLAKIDLLPILVKKTKVKIPPEVQMEAVADPRHYDAKIIEGIIRAGKIEISERLSSEKRKKIEEDFGIDLGEAAALLLAKQENAALGTDDGRAIKAAKIMGISFFTAIHVLTQLFENKRIEKKAALVKLDRLSKIGRYNVQIMEDARERIQRGR